MYALTEAQRAAQRATLGWLPCRHERWRAIDPRIESRLAPTLAVVDGAPVATWSHAFTPGCRAAMERAIDERAEELRLATLTPGSAQALVYRAKLDEARALVAQVAQVALGAGDDAAAAPDPKDFPLLAAGLGIDGADLPEVAAAVLAASARWRAQAARIERARLHGKRAVRTAATDQAAYEAFCEAFCEAFGEAFRTVRPAPPQ